MTQRTDTWNGKTIRFVEIDGEWYAVLKDICDALNISNARVVRYRIPIKFMEKVSISDVSSNYVTSDLHSTEVTSRARHTQTMIVVNSKGVYYAFLGSRKLEAQKFVDWIMDTIDAKRAEEGYEEHQILQFVSDKAKTIDRTNDDYISDYAHAAWDLRYWEGERWLIETGLGEMVTVREYCDDMVPEELSEEIYDKLYSMFGGQI